MEISMNARPSVSALSRRNMLIGGAATVAAGAICAPSVVLGQSAKTKVKFTCDFRMYGETAPWFYGQDLGIFDKLGIDATVDGSTGSVDAIKRVSSVAYEYGCADINSLVEFAAVNPTVAPKMVMVLFDHPAQAIVTLKSKGINNLADLKGKRLGVASTDGGTRIFPSLLKLNGIEDVGIERVVTEARLRDTLLIRNQADAVIGFDYTTSLNIISNGVPRSEVKILSFADYGFNFYANGLIASQNQIEKNPDLVRRMALACSQSWLASAANPAATIAAIKKRDDLTDVSLELERLNWVLDTHVMTPAFKKNGLGTLDHKRLDHGIKTVAEGLSLSRIPSTDEVYDGRFLPPVEARMAKS
jgi:NitT/TauT family transport system substrate-binding protein